MIFEHKLIQTDLNLDTAAARHSGDKTVTYKVVDGQNINLSYYYPKNFGKEKKHPAFIFIHGGGWASHKIFNEQGTWQGDYLGYLARYYADKGFVGISIDYRLSSPDGQAENYQVIDCCDDCFSAVDYILDNAAENGIDTDWVYVLGESAGGHLAAYVTTKYKREGFSFKGSFIVNGITDMVSDNWNERVPRSSKHPELSVLEPTKFAEYLSPLFNIKEDICPVVLIHGESDGCVDLSHSVKFHEKMCELGKKCELHIIEKTNHAFLLYEYKPDNTAYIMACKIGVGIIDNYLLSDM